VAKRTCDACGKNQYIEGGKTCENGHFICKKCVWEGVTLLSGSDKKYCPLCKKRLR